MNAATPLAHSLDRRRSFIRLLWLGTLLVNLFVGAVVAFVIAQNREQETVQAAALTGNYAKILEENLTGFIAKIDVTLLTVQEEVQRQIARGGIDRLALERFIAQQDTHLPEALGLRVVDAQGIIRYAVNDVKVQDASIADRPQFIRLRNDRDAGLVFSQPILGRAAQKWMITLSRRIDNPDGSFAGDVHVAVAVDHFIAMFGKIDLGPRGNIGLWDKTQLIARYARDDKEGSRVGVATPSPELHRLLAAPPMATTYLAHSGVDGVVRTYAFRSLEKYPLYLVVGLAEEDYLTDWRAQSLGIAGLVLLFVVATLLSAWLIQRGWQRREESHALLLRQEAAYTAQLEQSHREAETARRHSALVLDSAGEGICGVDQTGTVIFVNPAARRMFGWAEDEGLGLNLHQVTHHRRADGTPYPDQECPVFQTLHDGLRREIKDDLYWRRDGSAFPVEYTVSPMTQNGEITGAVNLFRDVTERKQLEERITRLALYDELTGLPNRSFLTDTLPRLVALAERRAEAVGILYLDLDGFKNVNDTLGHAAGDAVLQEVARRLQAALRAGDVVARLGGDEFLVVSLTGQANIQDNNIAVARRIIATLAEPIPLAQGMAHIGVSVGIATYSLAQGSIERYIQQADAAMYRAKSAGKGCYALAEADPMAAK